MCALAHFFESEGLATTTIALIRKHAETIRPPRALWVPFELGRPVGPPNDAVFQGSVVKAALSLLDREDGPVILDDFPDEAPGEDDHPDWQPPAIDSSQGVVEELRSIAAAAKTTQDRLGFSNSGITGVPIETLADYLSQADSDNAPERPTKKLAPIQVLRFGADDLKAHYVEAAVAAGPTPSSRQLWHWFWRDTLAGKVILDLWVVSKASDNESRKGISGSLVPQRWQQEADVMARVGIEVE